MKKGWILVACIGTFALWSCHNGAKKESATTEVTAETGNQPEQSVSDLMFISEWTGKYPHEVNLWAQPALDTRLKALLGNQYEEFIANWNTETPIILVNEVIHTSGCKTNDCSSDSYDLYIDLPNDNINVYNIQNEQVMLYTEKDTISLPYKLKKELNIIISNANFLPSTVVKAEEEGI